MGKRVNRYKLKTGGLKVEKSLSVNHCLGKSDKEIAELILIEMRFFNTLDSLRNGKREFELTQLR